MTANAPYYHDVDHYGLSAALYPNNPSSETPITSLEENHNFVELLEAATTAAAGQVTQAMGPDKAVASTRGKRKRALSSPACEPAAVDTPRTTGPERTRIEAPTDPQLRCSDELKGSRSQSGSLPPTSESLLNDARAAGVHSAAALFRRTSEKASRKHTRPPMSKLFMSLQLTPENFLHLQAQAKSYMLDPAHPDRQSCVGSRGKGDTDMVKLRLFNCVKDFLSGGTGDRFFGEHVEKPGEAEAVEAARALGEDNALAEDRLLWPRDGNKIISLVTPLLRRMVTNERQRMYAIETRKGSTKKNEASIETVPTTDNDGEEGQQLIAERLQATTLPSQLLHLPITHPQGRDFDKPLSNATHPVQSGAPKPLVKEYKELAASRYVISPHLRLDLPTQPDPEPVIKNLNFLVAKLTPSLRSDRPPEPILLQVYTRLANSQWAPLFHMEWEELCHIVELLLREALDRYPGLASPFAEPPNEGISRSVGTHSGVAQHGNPVEKSLSELAPETLRGLAVAATEIQHNNSSKNAESIAVEENPLADAQATSSQNLRSLGTTLPSTSAVVLSPARRTRAASAMPASSPETDATTSAAAVAISFVEPRDTPSFDPERTMSAQPSVPHCGSILTSSTALRVPSKTPSRYRCEGGERSSQALEPAPLPRFKLETQWTMGLRTIGCADDWANVKLDVAYATWADRTLNVIVTIL